MKLLLTFFVSICIVHTARAQTGYIITDTAIVKKLDACKDKGSPVLRFKNGRADIRVSYSESYLTIVLYEHNNNGVIVKQHAIVFTRTNAGWSSEAPLSGKEEFENFQKALKERL